MVAQQSASGVEQRLNLKSQCRALPTVSLAALGMLLSGCFGTSTTPEPEEFDATNQVLENLADNIYLADLREAKTRVRTLVTACEENLAAIGTANAEAARVNAQAAWGDAIKGWQIVELQQVGPLGAVAVVGGGESIRDEIYSWPTRSGCRVDQRTATEAYSSGDFFQANLVDVYGLDAIEHLLFREGRENVCAPLASINSDGSWDALSDADISLRRARYALTAAAEVERQIDLVIARWTDGFRDSFVVKNANVFESPRGALNDAFAALFYVELQTKDRKLAVPAGLNAEGCPEGRCPQALELSTSRFSKEAIIENLRGARRVYFGGEGNDGMGFNALVSEAGRPELNESIDAAFAAALATATALGTPLEVSLEESTADTVALYESVKAVTDLLKSDLTTLLNLEVPQEAAGDND